ncbi:hypothetical protein INR49_023322, partial [Caranx melampygus]
MDCTVFSSLRGDHWEIKPIFDCVSFWKTALVVGEVDTEKMLDKETYTERKRGGKEEEGKDGRKESRKGDITKEGERRPERGKKDYMGVSC